jgi:hypothetical protein
MWQWAMPFQKINSMVKSLRILNFELEEKISGQVSGIRYQLLPVHPFTRSPVHHLTT